MAQTWRADAGINRDTDFIPEIVNCRHHWKRGDNIKNYLLFTGVLHYKIYNQFFLSSWFRAS